MPRWQKVALEKRYCEENGITVGTEIVIADRSYQVVGIGSVPDYDAPLKKYVRQQCGQ